MSIDLGCKDTICALSSAQGPAALALVRASGPMALNILQNIFRRKSLLPIKPFMAMHGNIVDKEEKAIDDVMAIYFPKNKSFTGEESFEIHCHGNALIVEQLLRALCALGARLAEPGEFSMRAMLNGKIDLAQAESIADLIHAESEVAKDVALKGVLGGLNARCAPIRSVIVALLSEIEARMDFPDEELGSFHRAKLSDDLDDAISKLDSLLENASFALKLHEGARLVICGLPNAGKSTLLNCLAGHERAIVHESAGTTRDVIEARMSIGGVTVTIVDVAGIRPMEEASAIEGIGIERAFLELRKADVVIWLADSTLDAPFANALIEEKLENIKVPVLRVANKVELKDTLCEGALPISAKLGHGIEDLKGTLHKLIVGEKNSHSEMFITRARQRDELFLARQALVEAQIALQQHMIDEVTTSELRAAGLAFDRLFGTCLAEEVLDRIFAEFCIGK